MSDYIEAQIGGIGPWDDLPEPLPAPAPFDVDAALWIASGENGVYVHLASREDGSAYVLHMVWDNAAGCGDMPSSTYAPTSTLADLVRAVEGACWEAAEIVHGWGCRRPGLSRLRRPIVGHVRDAMRELEDARLSVEAATEQSADYFNRYIAGDR
jgi:hypothetical protein